MLRVQRSIRSKRVPHLKWVIVNLVDSLNSTRSGELHLCIYIQNERVSVANERAHSKLGLFEACLLRVYCAGLAASLFSTIFMEKLCEVALVPPGPRY